MELHEAIRGRRSIRRFSSESVPLEVLVSLTRAGMWAPSAGNAQSWRFVIVDDAMELHRLKAVSPGMLADPAAVIAVCQDKDLAYRKGAELGRDVGSVMDAAMAAQNILLAAYAAGLGTCAILSFHAASVQRILHLPEHVAPELLIAVGVPAMDPAAPARHEEDVVFRNTMEPASSLAPSAATDGAADGEAIRTIEEA